MSDFVRNVFQLSTFLSKSKIEEFFNFNKCGLRSELVISVYGFHRSVNVEHHCSVIGDIVNIHCVI